MTTPPSTTDRFRFCPECGGRLQVRELKAGDPPRHVCERCGFVFYLDPKVAVGTIIRDGNGRVMLVRRAIEPGYGRWVFPGGYVDRGEPVEVAAEREAREECGLTVRLDGLVGIYSYTGRTPIIVVFAATALDGEVCADEECLEAAWFPTDALPWGELAFWSTQDALEDYLAGYLAPLPPPGFLRRPGGGSR